MRVSSRCYELASKELYNKVVCDDLGKLTFGITRRPSKKSNRRPKIELIQSIKALQLEYSDKWSSSENYTIFRTGKWVSIGNERSGKATPLQKYKREVHEFREGLLNLWTVRTITFRCPTFKNLETITLGPFFQSAEKENEFWPKVWDSTQFRDKKISNVFLVEVLASPSIKSICQHTTSGPSSFPAVSILSAPTITPAFIEKFPQNIKITIHFKLKDKKIPVIFGYPVKWILNLKENWDYSLYHVTTTVYELFSENIHARYETEAPVVRKGGKKERMKLPLNIEIYASSRIWRPEDEEDDYDGFNSEGEEEGQFDDWFDFNGPQYRNNRGLGAVLEDPNSDGEFSDADSDGHDEDESDEESRDLTDQTEQIDWNMDLDEDEVRLTDYEKQEELVGISKLPMEQQWEKGDTVIWKPVYNGPTCESCCWKPPML